MSNEGVTEKALAEKAMTEKDPGKDGTNLLMVNLRKFY